MVFMGVDYDYNHLLKRNDEVKKSGNVRSFRIEKVTEGEVILDNGTICPLEELIDGVYFGMLYLTNPSKIKSLMQRKAFAQERYIALNQNDKAKAWLEEERKQREKEIEQRKRKLRNMID